MLNIYRKILELRKEHGWSQDELAKKVGLADKSMISRIENGKIDIKVSQVVAFAEAFGITVTELLGEAGKEESSEGDLAKIINENVNYKQVIDAIQTALKESIPVVQTSIESNVGELHVDRKNTDRKV